MTKSEDEATPRLDLAAMGKLALYTTPEAARYLGCSTSSIRRLIRGCRIVPDMLGGTENRKCHVFKLATLEAYVVRQAGRR